VGRTVDDQVGADIFDGLSDTRLAGDIQLPVSQRTDLVGRAEYLQTVLPQLSPGTGDHNFHRFSPLK
jgi:hypothetical protein